MAHDLVDWKVAPKDARWWAMDANGKAHWYCEPDVAPFTEFWFAHSERAPHFDYAGKYKESLTERPAHKKAAKKL